MERKVYVSAFARISPRHPDPDYTGMFPVMEARRMSRLMKRALAVSQQVLRQAGVAVPDAIVTGTGLGCIENTEHFIRSLSGLSDAPLRPTHFMQSTHNTIGSLIAIRLHCHGYNATYSQSAVSFESALLDAFLQIRMGLVENALVGAFEEMTPAFATLLERTGDKDVRVGDVLSETAVSMLLSADPAGARCELADVTLRSPIGLTPPVMPGLTGHLLPRAEYVARYGNNFCVSALGACDAIERIADGTDTAVTVLNEVPGRSSATLLFQSVCGR